MVCLLQVLSSIIKMLEEFRSAGSLYRNASAKRPLGGGKGASSFFFELTPRRRIFQRVSHQTFSHISRMLWLLWPLVVRYTWNSVYHLTENVHWHTHIHTQQCFLCTCRFRVCYKKSSFHHFLLSLSSKSVLLKSFCFGNQFVHCRCTSSAPQYSTKNVYPP